MRLDDLPTDRKAEAGARLAPSRRPRLVDAVEALEDVWQMLGATPTSVADTVRFPRSDIMERHENRPCRCCTEIDGSGPNGTVGKLLPFRARERCRLDAVGGVAARDAHPLEGLEGVKLDFGSVVARLDWFVAQQVG